MAIGLANTVGFAGYRFVSALTGVTAGASYRVISGPARIGSSGLIIDIMPLGVVDVVVRGDGADVSFTLRGIASLSERSVMLAALAGGQSDAAIRASFGGAETVAVGTAAVGLLKGSSVTPPPPVPAPVFSAQPAISPASGTVGQVFTATAGIASNTTGYAGQWLLNGVEISGATALTYTSAAAGSLTYRSNATGPGGSTPATSAAVAVAAAAGVPTITFDNSTTSIAEANTGPTTVSNTINVTRNGVTGPLTINLTYGGTATSGSDYVTGPASISLADGVSSRSFDLTINGDTDVEPDETIIINAALAGYAATASKTITITNDDVASAIPVNTSSPMASGVGAVGQTATTDDGSWTNSPTSYQRQWQRGSTDIAGATGSTYTFVAADNGYGVRCRIIAVNGAGNSAPVYSNFIAVAATSSEEAAISPANTTARSSYAFADKGVILDGKPAWQTSGNGPYWPVIVDARSVAVWQGIADYLIYYSTDHAGGQGGIGLMVCRGEPDVAANWKEYDAAKAAGWFAMWTGGALPAGNPVFVNTRTASTQTETPWVSVFNGTFVMHYQVSATANSGGRNQPTGRVTSLDGLVWPVAPGTATLSVTEAQSIGDGHSGYFRYGPNPFSRTLYPYDFIGYSLTGGTDKSSQGMWGNNNPATGAWTFLTPLMKQTGRIADFSPGLAATFISWDPASAQPVRQGVAMLMTFDQQGSSGIENSASDMYECVIDSSGSIILQKPIKVLASGQFAGTEQGVHMPSVLTLSDRRVMVFQSKANTGGNTLRLASSPRRNYTNTYFDPIVPALPAVTPTRYSFTGTTPPTGMTVVAVNNAAPSFGSTGMVFTIAAGTTTPEEYYLWEDGSFVPANCSMVEVKVDGWRDLIPNGSASRRFLLGFGQTKGAKEALTDGIFLTNYNMPDNTNLGGNPLLFRQLANGASVAPATSQWHPGVGYGTSGDNRQSPKYLGLRWLPQLGRMFVLAEGKNGGGIEIEEIALDAAFKPGGSRFNTPLFAGFGIMGAGNQSRTRSATLAVITSRAAV